MAEPSAVNTTGVAQPAPRLLRAVPIALIAVEPGFNPRTTMDEHALADLACSIALHGLLQPVLLRPNPTVAVGEGYYVTGGHRRFAASRLAGLETVPALVREDGDQLIAAVLDNSHRVDLNALEEAQAYRRAMQERGLTVQG